MSIQRWEDEGYGPCRPDPEGAWVRYADHIAEVERLQGLEAQDFLTAQHVAGEDMRAACIAAVIEYLNETPTQRQMDEYEAKYGSEWFQEALIAALREIQP
jgi:hypothetical protein